MVHFDITRVIMRNVAKGGKHVFVMEVLMMYLRFKLIFVLVSVSVSVLFC